VSVADFKRIKAGQHFGEGQVQKVEELQPDLIVLDIGLPTLNGIEQTFGN
jgi:CheY-like chemotaxis protein